MPKQENKFSLMFSNQGELIVAIHAELSIVQLGSNYSFQLSYSQIQRCITEHILIKKKKLRIFFIKITGNSCSNLFLQFD